MSRFHRTAALGLAALLAACSGDGATSPEVEIANATVAVTDAVVLPDVAASVSAVALADIDQDDITDALAPLSLSVNAPTASDMNTIRDEVPAARPCTFGNHGRQFSCTTRGSGSITVSRTVKFYDATGAEMTNFVRGTTEAVETTTKIDGSFERGDVLTNATHRENATRRTGFVSTPMRRTVNGHGSGADTTVRTTDRATRTYTMAFSDTTTDLVRRLGLRYPLSGSKTFVVTSKVVAEFDDETKTREFTANIKIVYDGDATAALTINGRECVLRLDTRRVRCP